MEELTSEINELQQIDRVNLTRMVRDLMGKNLLEMRIHQGFRNKFNVEVRYK